MLLKKMSLDTYFIHICFVYFTYLLNTIRSQSKIDSNLWHVLLLWYKIIILLLIIRDKLSYLCLLAVGIGAMVYIGKSVIIIVICNNTTETKFVLLVFYLRWKTKHRTCFGWLHYLITEINVTLSCKIFIKFIEHVCVSSKIVVRKGYGHRMGGIRKYISIVRWFFMEISCFFFVNVFILTMFGNK